MVILSVAPCAFCLSLFFLYWLLRPFVVLLLPSLLCLNPTRRV